MSNSLSTNTPTSPAFRWPSLLQFIFSLLAALILFGASVIIVGSAIIKTTGTNPSDPTEAFMLAASLAFSGALVLPSAWYSWQHIAHPDQEPTSRLEWHRVGLILTLIVIVLVGGSLWLGNWSAQNNYYTWLLLPPLNIIATGLPALWLVYIGTRGLVPGAPRLKWGVFATGLVLGPLISLILELILLVLIGVLALIWIMLNPTLANQLTGLAYRLQNAGPNLDVIIKLLAPFLLNPGIIFLLFAFISVLVPLLEEAIKPIGVWTLVGQKLTSAQGFAYGVLSGAGFGLFENLGNTSGGATDWALLASTRISALLLHCFTVGIVGWALVSSWNDRRYLRLILTYLVAVVIHGLWNGLSLVSLASSLQDVTDVTVLPNVQQVVGLAFIGIAAIGAIVFIAFFGANFALRHSIQGQAPSQYQAGQSPQPTEQNRSPEISKPQQSSFEINPNPADPPEEHPTSSTGEPQNQNSGGKSPTKD